MLGDELRRQLAVGIDPVKHACTEKQARPVAAENSFKTVAIQWSGTWKPVRSAQHADQVMRRFEADAFPQNRAIPVTVVAATALMAMLNAIQAAPTPCTCSARKIRSSVSIRPKWLLQHSQLSTGGRHNRVARLARCSPRLTTPGDPNLIFARFPWMSPLRIHLADLRYFSS